MVPIPQRGLRFAHNVGSWISEEPFVISDSEQYDPIPFQGIRKFWANLFVIPRLFSTKATITIDESIRYQTITGFGGSITTSVAYLQQKLPEALQSRILESFYSDITGIGYNIVRMSIGASDFDFEPWTYNETPVDDVALSNFTRLDRRTLMAVKNIKKIKAIMAAEEGRNLKIAAAAWGCPPWMRSPELFEGYGVLKRKYYQTWADYHLRFLELMRDEAGLDIWGLSTGNEPSTSILSMSFNHWISLAWWPKDLATYVADHLGPTLKSSRFKDVSIMLGEDQRYALPWAYLQMKQFRPDAFDYVDSIALHGYFDHNLPNILVDWTREAFPKQNLINTEFSVGGNGRWPKGALLGSWDRGVEYMVAYFRGLMLNLTGWIDWNLMLDEEGGPSYANNTIDAPILANVTAGEVYKQPIFYAIGHFSKFIPEGSVRFDVQSDWSEVQTIGFRRPDGTAALIVFNSFPESVEVTLNDKRRGMKEVRLPASSITTFVYV